MDERTRPTRPLAGVLLLLVAIGLPQRSSAQDSPAETEKEKEAALRKESRAHVEKFVVTDMDGRPYEVVDAPLLSSTDPARGELGALWAFGTEGRPVAVLELYKDAGQEERWVQVVTLTSDKLVEARLPPSYVWSPRRTQVEFRPLPETPAPAGRSSLRERQAKLLARRFDAHEFWNPNNSRFELRLLERPLYTYRDPQSGILDGVLFALVHGTNAEILLFIEAVAEQQGEPRWMYALARVGSAEMHANLDGEEVWQVDRTPGVVGSAVDPFWITIALTASE